MKISSPNYSQLLPLLNEYRNDLKQVIGFDYSRIYTEPRKNGVRSKFYRADLRARDIVEINNFVEQNPVIKVPGVGTFQVQVKINKYCPYWSGPGLDVVLFTKLKNKYSSKRLES